ncbi:MAG: nuclear transport factor 2 family protein [Bryobacteraceae bacterium]|nr:nuclear transport factor 2 family protein [Bryobacteraceae bacterium]
MSTNNQSGHDVPALDQELNNTVLGGDILGAFDKFYADDVVMQENSAEPFVGKAVNREREEKFVASIEAFHSGKVVCSAVNGDVSFSQWEMDATLTGAGRIKMEQVAVRQWKDGKVVHERFFYKG